MFYYPPQQNGLQKTLDAQLDSGVTSSMTLNNTTNVQNKPGVVVVNRIDADGNEKSASEREFIIYTAISGSTLTGLTRNADGGSSDQDHAVGSIVEFVLDIKWGQSVIDALNRLIDESTGDVEIRDSNDNELLSFTETASAENELTIANAATGNFPVISATGGDTNIGIKLTPKGTGEVEITANDLNLSGTNPNVQVDGSDPWRTIDLTPGFLKPTTTDGCADSATVEAGTNDIDYDVLDFDTSSAERAFANFQMPDSYDGGAIQFRYIWTNADGSSAETVEFELSGRSYTDDDAIDQAVGTAVGVSDTWIAQGDIHISDWSSDVTLAGSPTAGDWVHLEIKRDVANDDLTGDARLIGVQIRFKQAKFSD